MPSEGPPGFSGIPVSAIANHCWYIFSFTATANSIPLMAGGERKEGERTRDTGGSGGGVAAPHQRMNRRERAAAICCGAVIPSKIAVRVPLVGAMSSLAAARADNFYVPPDWTPEAGSLNKFAGCPPGHLGKRAKKLDQGILVIRCAAPRRRVQSTERQSVLRCANAPLRPHLAALRCPSTFGAPDAAT